MQIADLFINLGIKGAEKTASSISNVGEGMKKTASMSLEAKAAIIGATYALQQFFASSGHAGTDLTNFNALLGVSTQTLQQYQYAARQVGVSNQEVEGSFKALQNSMTKILLGEGVPKGYGRLAEITGNISSQDIKKYQEHPEELLKRLQKYTDKESNIGLRNETLGSFGLGDKMKAALARGAFRESTLATAKVKAPTYSEQEIAALDRANIAWSNLGNKIEMAVGHFNALHGGQIVNDISMIAEKVLLLADALIKLEEKLGVFKGFSDFLGLVSGGLDRVLKASDSPKEQEKLKTDAIDFFKDLPGIFKEITKDLIGNKDLKGTDLIPQDVIFPVKDSQEQKAADLYNKIQNKKKGTVDQPLVVQSSSKSKGETPSRPSLSPKPSTVIVPKVTPSIMVPGRDTKSVLKSTLEKSSVLRSEKEKTNLRLVSPNPASITPERIAQPKVEAPAAAAANHTQNIEVKQNLHFQHEGKDSRQTGDSVKKAVSDAFRQMSSQTQAN